jgi:hypothetical protein
MLETMQVQVSDTTILQQHIMLTKKNYITK